MLYQMPSRPRITGRLRSRGPERSPGMKLLGRLLLALLVSLLFGVVVGTALRLRLERPAIYIGLAAPSLPLDIGHTGAVVLDAGHHEEQVRQAVEEAQAGLRESFLPV